MPRTAEETTNWVAGVLSEKALIEDVEVTGIQTVRITRKKFEPFNAGVVSSGRVASAEVKSFTALALKLDFVVNVPRDSIWTGSAINLLSGHQIAFGGMGDIMSATAHEDVSSYIRKEFSFVERGLHQHNRVSSLDRVFDRVYCVNRFSLRSITFVMLNEYELTAEHVRTARDRYGNCDLLLLNNPNGNATRAARDVAKSLGIEIHKWGSLLGRLNAE